MPAPSDSDLHVERIRHPDRDTGPYEVRFYFTSGDLTLVSVAVFGWTTQLVAALESPAIVDPPPPGVTPTPITHAAIRIPLERLTAEARARAKRRINFLASTTQQVSDSLRVYAAETAIKWDATDGQRSGRGRQPLYDDEHWEQVAEIYLAARRAPTLAVKKHYGISKGTAAGWVSKCRSRGLLAPTTKGVVSSGAVDTKGEA